MDGEYQLKKLVVRLDRDKRKITNTQIKRVEALNALARISRFGEKLHKRKDAEIADLLAQKTAIDLRIVQAEKPYLKSFEKIRQERSDLLQKIADADLELAKHYRLEGLCRVLELQNQGWFIKTITPRGESAVSLGDRCKNNYRPLGWRILDIRADAGGISTLTSLTKQNTYGRVWWATKDIVVKLSNGITPVLKTVGNDMIDYCPVCCEPFAPDLACLCPIKRKIITELKILEISIEGGLAWT